MTLPSAALPAWILFPVFSILTAHGQSASLHGAVKTAEGQPAAGARVVVHHTEGSVDLTIVAGLFDRNGNFISGEQKTLEMRLKDTTLEKLDQTGVTLKTSFDVKPGGYMVRLVVRDSKAAQLSARNGVVEIP